MLRLPAGGKLSQMIARSGRKLTPDSFLAFAEALVADSMALGTSVQSAYIRRSGSTIYRRGNEYLTVALDGTLLSYVGEARPNEGVVMVYRNAGGTEPAGEG